MKVQVTDDNGGVLRTVSVISDVDLREMNKYEVFGPLIDTSTMLHKIDDALGTVAHMIKSGNGDMPPEHKPASTRPVRLKTWLQDSPRMQLTSVTQSVQGDVSNLLREPSPAGHDMVYVMLRVQQNMKEMQQLLVLMNHGFVNTWPPQE